jgi:hypothetical protein
MDEISRTYGGNWAGKADPPQYLQNGCKPAACFQAAALTLFVVVRS